MGNGNGKGRDKRRKKDKVNVRQELLSLGMMVAGLLTLLSFLDVGGLAGKFIKSTAFTILGGVASWLFLLMIFVIIIFPLKDIGLIDQRKRTRVSYSNFLTISVASLAATIRTSKEVYPAFLTLWANLQIHKI